VSSGIDWFELDRAMQFEPVNAGADLNPDLAGFAERFPFGLDVPAFGDQFPDDVREFRRGDFPARLLLVIVRPDVFQPDFSQSSYERGFGVTIAQDVAAAFYLVDAPARILFVENALFRFGRVIERESRAQPGVLSLRFEPQTRPRLGVDLRVTQLFGQIEPGGLRFAQDFGHELADLIFRTVE